MDLEAEIDRLYSLPLGEFVAERNALSRELRARGERLPANDIKALAKPNVPAWVVNRLWHGERAAFDRLFEAATELREAVAAGGGGREAATRRGTAARSLLTRAKKLLAAAGHPATPAVLKKVSHTLDAVVVLGADRLDRPLGRLIQDLEPPGFDFLAGLELPAAPKRSARIGNKATKKAPVAAHASEPAGTARQKAARERRCKRIEAARQALDQSHGALATAKKTAKQVERELEEARELAAETAAAARRAAEAADLAAKRARKAKDAGEKMATEAKAARAAVRRATAKVKAAQARLAKLGG